MANKNEKDVWYDIQSNEEKAHINIYDSDPKGEHNSIHINIDYETGTGTINEKEDGKKTSTKIGCFLTTACLKHMPNSFDDKCYELEMLRWFRDIFVTKDDKEYYYKIAPKIVETINKKENAEKIYETIYYYVVKNCVDLIEKGKYRKAYEVYKSVVIRLEEKYLNSNNSRNISKALRLNI